MYVYVAKNQQNIWFTGVKHTKMVLKNMIQMQIVMFLFMMIGYIIRKKSLFSEQGRKDLVNFCLYVTLPFNIFASFFIEWEWGMIKSFIFVILLSSSYCLISVLSSILFYRRVEDGKRKPLRYGTIVSNGGFLGNPVIEGIYGSVGVFYASVFMIPVRIVMWSVGTSCFMKEKEGNVLRKVATHPCLLAVYFGMIVLLTGVSLSSPVQKVVTGISMCNTPISMMLVGMMLSEMKPKGILDKSMMIYAGVRLMLIPAILFVGTSFLTIPKLLQGVAVIISGMPAPITTALLSAKYGANEKYGTGMIFVSTILSLFTLPFWCWMVS